MYQDKIKIKAWVDNLIREGENPTPAPGSTCWDIPTLRQWYIDCITLNELLGKGNSWEKWLTKFESGKEQDKSLHADILAVLKSIKKYLDFTD